MGEGIISGWTEGILLTIATVLVIGLIITNFNGLYEKDYELGLGTNTTAQDFIKYQDDASREVEGGTATFQSDAGLTLSSSWGITKQVFKIVGAFITGGFIEDIFLMANLGEAGQIWATYLRVLWFLSLIFGILYILFKVKG